jgi:hypothetical protein
MMLPNISYTLLSTYERCRKKCLLELVKRVVAFEEVNNRPFIVGSVSDWLFCHWIEEENYKEGWMESRAEDLFAWFSKKRRIIYRDKGDKQKLIFKLQNAVRRIESAAFAENLPDRKLVLQKKIKTTRDGLNFVGKVDIWFPEEELLWDLKVTESTKYLNPFQLMFFAWLFSIIDIPIKSVGFFSPLMKKYLRESDVTQLDLDETERRAYGIIALMRENEWGATTTECWGCPVMDFCEEDVTIDRMKKNKSGGFTIDVGEVR